MDRRRPLRARIAAPLAITLAMSMVAAACSDDEGTTDDTSAPTTAAPETTAPPEPGETTTTAAATGEPGLVFGYLRPAPGLLAELATAQEAALQLAIDDINAAGGVNGQPVALLTADEPLDGDVVGALEGLLDDGAAMLLGPVGSTSAAAVLPTLAERGVIACSASATATSLTTLDTEGVLYRTAFPDGVTVVHLADTIAAEAEAAELPEGQAYRVSIVERGDDYGTGVGNGLASALIARGIEVEVTTYHPRRVIFREEAAAVAAADPDAVVMVSYGEGVRLLADLVEAGVPVERIIGLDGMFDPRVASRAFPSEPTRADGVRLIAPSGDRAFLGRLIGDETLPQVIFGAQMYDCAILGALAAQAAGSFDAAPIGEAMSTVSSDGRSCSTVADCLDKLNAGEDIDYEGASGGVRFDDQGDPAEARLTTATFTDGEFTPVSSVDLDLDELRQQEALANAIFVTRIQQVLTALGLYSGPIDGQWSDEVSASVGALQALLGVPVTGVWDAATDEALRARYGDITGQLDESIAGLQQLLTDLGFYDGPIDGRYSQATVDAVRAFQRALGVPETGIIDAATLAAAFEQGIVIGAGTTTTTTTAAPTTTEAPTTTAPPATTTPPATTAPVETTAPTTAPTTTAPPATTLPPVTPPDPETPTIGELLRADGRFTTLLELIAAAGFGNDTAVIGPITLLAPTDEAFESVDPAVLEAIVADPDLLEAVLSYHLAEGALTLEQLAALTEFENVYGELLTVTVDGSGVVSIDGSATVAPELLGRNGVVIPLASVLVPPDQP
jgi:branched-chain amino acid transport system substrate-binding protein